MKENQADQENHVIPDVVSSAPSGAIAPTKLSTLAKQTSIVVRFDVWNNSATPRRIGRGHLPDLSACKAKDATSTPANAVSTSVGSVLSDNNNNRAKRTRTPTQLSPLLKLDNNVQLSDTSRISLTPRPRGRPRVTDISTRTLISRWLFFRVLLPVNSISNDKDLIKPQGDIQLKITLIMEILPLNALDCGACYEGKVSLTNEVDEPPPLLKELITNKHPKSDNFIENIRRYNSMFAFTSMGGKQDTSVNVGRGLYCYRMHGENYHLAGPLLPETGKPAKFAQLYIFDTENEIQNRIATVSNGEGSSSSKHNKLDYKLTTDIRDLLDEINPLVKDFRMAGEHFDSTEHKRVIILQCQDDDFKRINELHPSYLALHYPLFYITERDNYRTDIFHEGDLRSETYSKLANSSQKPNSGVKLCGKKVVLNSNFTGSPRYMMQNYLDAMTLCNFYGYPDLFITFTCNPKWPEISRFMAKRVLNPKDRPDIISRVFKIKLDCLMKELKDDHTFGRVEGDHMMHGPCGAENPSYPCTADYKCTKKFPKQFNESTVIEDNGYGIYKRRNDGATVKKSRINLHNDYVVPYNPGLLRVIATIDGEEVDEIKDYLNCRYLSSCEAAWRIYGFDIHYKTPSVERLPFHLKDEQQVIFDATESIDYAVDKSSVNETKFESWMQLNQTDTFARSLLYVEIPRYFVWNQKQRVWTRRKQGKSLGRIHHVPPSWGEVYYLRAILNKVRGPMEWDDLKKVDDVLYPTYRDACYARGLLQDDKEYIDGLLEASFWGMGDYLRSIFVMLIMTDSGMFFVYGYGGIGKTYLYKTMSAALRSKGEIVLNVASSGIAALLLEGGRMAHSRFVITPTDRAWTEYVSEGVTSS
ncbi:putative PIF1 DNA helicase/replication protein A1-like protein [Tanacetum coccineum]